MSVCVISKVRKLTGMDVGGALKNFHDFFSVMMLSDRVKTEKIAGTNIIIGMAFILFYAHRSTFYQ